ncbi:hypothetical protein AVEN_148922-1 [Araneus ventricosus]|uniref:Retrovirus-related Pol polyprotein from transposon TNT 1-94-like beta-barrel domain-containing protein n=1 Tax=Araneus ventricosus TaxID=182803 RepID=A0A4Y2DK42_ARAVE|nr:hypothetical protein AVEN_148922-1 [Araneus ventricosus]
MWECVPVKERTINNLTKRLRLIQMRLPGKQVEHSDLVANTSVNKRMDKPKQEKVEKKFFRCHKLGHLAKKCYKKSSYTCTLVMSNLFQACTLVMSNLLQACCKLKLLSGKDVGLADSGASAHMTPHKECILTYEAFSSPQEVKISNNETIFAFGQGTVNIRMLVPGKWENNHLSDVWLFLK